jgi:hypothetical protein
LGRRLGSRASNRASTLVRPWRAGVGGRVASRRSLWLITIALAALACRPDRVGPRHLVLLTIDTLRSEVGLTTPIPPGRGAVKRDATASSSPAPIALASVLAGRAGASTAAGRRSIGIRLAAVTTRRVAGAGAAACTQEPRRAIGVRRARARRDVVIHALERAAGRAAVGDLTDRRTPARRTRGGTRVTDRRGRRR